MSSHSPVITCSLVSLVSPGALGLNSSLLQSLSSHVVPASLILWLDVLKFGFYYWIFFFFFFAPDRQNTSPNQCLFERNNFKHHPPPGNTAVNINFTLTGCHRDKAAHENRQLFFPQYYLRLTVMNEWSNLLKENGVKPSHVVALLQFICTKRSEKCFVLHLF